MQLDLTLALGNISALELIIIVVLPVEGGLDQPPELDAQQSSALQLSAGPVLGLIKHTEAGRHSPIAHAAEGFIHHAHCARPLGNRRLHALVCRLDEAAAPRR